MNATVLEYDRVEDVKAKIEEEASRGEEHTYTLIIKTEEVGGVSEKKSKWAEVARRAREQSPLRGASGYVQQMSKEFRDNFELGSRK